MNQTRSLYRHPRHDDIVRMLKDGATNKHVAQTLRVDKRAVVRVRDILGLARAHGNATTREDKIASFSVPLDGGHTGWTGRTATSGAPVIRHRGIELAAAHVAFQTRTGREPVGIVKAECGFHDCLTPAHVADELERRKVRMQERALYGLEPQPWAVCPSGHSWDDHGRIYPDLKPYCKGCNTERARRVRDAKREEADA